MEEVAILNVLIMLLDVALLTFPVVRKLCLVLGQRFLDYHHRVVSISHVLLGGVCPSFWLRLQDKFVEAEFQFFAFHLFRCLVGRKLQIIVAAGPQVLSVLHPGDRVSPQMPRDLFVATFDLGVLLGQETVTYQGAHIVGQILFVEGFVVVFLDFVNLQLKSLPVLICATILDGISPFRSRSEILHLRRRPIGVAHHHSLGST